MPLLDVTDILSDPDFADTFSVIRLAETVGNDGMTALVPTTTSGVSGVVTQAGGDVLKLLPEGARAEGSILINTTYRLAAATSSHAADEVVWNGQTFTVTAVQDWSRFGAGFICAVCTVKDLVGP